VVTLLNAAAFNVALRPSVKSFILSPIVERTAQGVVVGCLAAGKRPDYAFSRALQRLPCSAFNSRATAVARVRALP